jgi:hypothetical protein
MKVVWLGLCDSGSCAACVTSPPLLSVVVALGAATISTERHVTLDKGLGPRAVRLSRRGAVGGRLCGGTEVG